jgi:tRNA A37 threonylcarbamoyladenosine dehydratase
VSDYEARFEGVRRLYGPAAAERLRAAHVCVVGMGGVGSWAVEALARSGIGTLTLVDFDDVCVSNINRQLPATTRTLAQFKVNVMRERVLDINPECVVHAREEFFTAATAESLFAARYDCVLDAIDTVASKCLLIARARQARMPIVAAGGAGGRKNPASVRVADLAKASHDRLLQRARKVLRTDYGFPAGEEPFGVLCVFSPEQPSRPGGEACAAAEAAPGNCHKYGTAAFVTGAFGLAAAGCVINTLAQQAPE